jgi:hypothetical protein
MYVITPSSVLLMARLYTKRFISLVFVVLRKRYKEQMKTLLSRLVDGDQIIESERKNNLNIKDSVLQFS